MGWGGGEKKVQNSRKTCIKNSGRQSRQRRTKMQKNISEMKTGRERMVTRGRKWTQGGVRLEDVQKNLKRKNLTI